MSHVDIIRAWKDEDYRNSLSEEQRAQLPENPAGMVELSDEAMQTVAGGLLSIFGCNGGGGNTSNPVFTICIPTQGLTCSTINVPGDNLCG
jgi:mersacidin/lichenicidin family type 2 lantibiotic